MDGTRMTDLARALSVLADARQLVAIAERAQIERDIYRTIARAALDQLALVATVPERYEAMQREEMKDREWRMKLALLVGLEPAPAAELARGTEGQT